jgi:hypothetical protein
MVKEIYSHHPHHNIDATTTNNYFVNRVEKVDDQLKKTSPSPATSTSVTSPIFNSMTVVQTSTPSSSNSSSSNSSNNDINNNNKASVETTTTTTNAQFESNKIKLNIQNSRPTLQQQQQQTSGGGGSASSTLKLIIQKQDFAVQVSKDELVSQTGMMSRAPVVKVVQGSNMNAGNFGRAKKSIDVIDNEYTKGRRFVCYCCCNI